MSRLRNRKEVLVATVKRAAARDGIQAVADRLGVSHATVAAWLRGERLPVGSRLPVYEAALGLAAPGRSRRLAVRRATDHPTKEAWLVNLVNGEVVLWSVGDDPGHLMASAVHDGAPGCVPVILPVGVQFPPGERKRFLIDVATVNPGGAVFDTRSLVRVGKSYGIRI